MKKNIIRGAALAILITFGYLLYSGSRFDSEQSIDEISSIPSVNKQINTNSENISPEVENKPVEAGFEIVTNGTKRIFTDPKYHNQSEMVYITEADPSVVYAKNNSTWEEFFESLPMDLNENCLTTGTGQVFCDGEDGKLTFYLNNTVTPDALNVMIKDGDFLKVVFE